MSLIEEFVPTAGYPKIKNWWSTYAILVILFTIVLFVQRGTTLSHIITEACVLTLLLVVFVTQRNAVKVTISTLDGIFTYKTVDNFGKERETKVLLSTAKITYKYVRRGHNSSGYRLRIYNGDIFNRISLMASRYGAGFREEQLDQMVALINKYLGVPVDEYS